MPHNLKSNIYIFKKYTFKLDNRGIIVQKLQIPVNNKIFERENHNIFVSTLMR